MNRPALLRLNTTELRRGDVVHTHGMRLLDADPVIWPKSDCRGAMWDVYAWHGTVLNKNEVTTGSPPHIPPSFLRTEKYDPVHGWITDRDDHWSIQGNELAHWEVERL